MCKLYKVLFSSAFFICCFSNSVKCQQLYLPVDSYAGERQKKAEQAANHEGNRGEFDRYKNSAKPDLEALRNSQVESVIRDYTIKHADLIINHQIETQAVTLGEKFALNAGKNLLLIGNVALIAQDINKKKYVQASSAVVCLAVSYAPPPYGLAGGIMCSLIRTSLLTIYENREEKSIILDANPILP